MNFLNKIKNYNMSSYFNLKRTIFFIFYSIYILSLFYIFYLAIRTGYAKDSWQITEFLINYQGGFVRRGLIGEILLTLYKYFNLNPYIIILSLSSFAYLCLWIFFLYSFLKKGLPIILLPFTFFLGHHVITGNWVRKDILITLIFIIVLYISIKKSSYYLFFVNLLLIIGILIHEGIVFISIPIILLILINNKNIYTNKLNLLKYFIISLFKISPAIATFILCIYFKGTPIMSQVIWQSWEAIPFPIQSSDYSTIPSALGGLSWSFNEIVSRTLNIFKNYDGGVFAPIAWFFIILIIYYYLTNIKKLKLFFFKIKKNNNIKHFSIILIFQLLMIFPLFIIGIDYGRWIFYWVTSSFSILVLTPSESLSTLFPKFLTRISLKINTLLNSTFTISKDFMYIIPFFIGTLFWIWNLDDYIKTTPIIIVLKSISEFIQILANLF